ncbi:MAG: hypothetical protein J6W52_12915 [Bacteroidaceae bacterium]|nr:hypothetical protein [Bacteroidaceae bacterium]
MNCLLTFFLLLASGMVGTVTHKSLVPEKPSEVPDYFSTWNIQGYVVSYDGPATPRVMTEQYMFGNGELEGWTKFFPDFREDLIFLMDDSWDVPIEEHKNELMGSARIDRNRFPNCNGSLKKLVNKTKKAGWKGLGGWICCQEASAASDAKTPDAYWAKRLKENHQAGMAYWKVDFGREERNQHWREKLTLLGRLYAPGMPIEHAYTYPVIEKSDVFRTYDVEVVTSVPVTLQRVSKLLRYKAYPGNMGLINCEDEPLIAVGLGCVIGVMRHPINKPLPNGQPDHVFPYAGRNLKARLDEVNRALKWHRLAAPFAVNEDTRFSVQQLTDVWCLREHETWREDHHAGDTLRESAPAVISRCMPLPEVRTSGEEPPYVLASRYPNGAVCVATVERLMTEEHSWTIPRADVILQMGNTMGPIGVFGNYLSLQLCYDLPIPEGIRIWAQDLIGKEPVEITYGVEISNNTITIPGFLLERIGTMASSPNDVSAPGLVLVIEKSRRRRNQKPNC